MFDILFTSSVVGVALIVLRLLLALVILGVTYNLINSILNNYIDVDDKPIPVFKFVEKNFLNFVVFFVAGAFFIFSFNTTPYLPKNTVEDVRSQEYVLEKQEFANEHTEVKPSEADAKAASRKSDINIREQFDKHQDKK